MNTDTTNPGTYWLGCRTCDHGRWFTSSKPRSPLCDRCTATRPKRTRRTQQHKPRTPEWTQ